MNTSRRTALTTAAWTVPAITVASAAPAFATSTDPRKDIEITAKNVASGDATFWVERHIAINGEAHAFQRRNGERGSMGDGFPSASSRARSFAHPSGVTVVMA